MLNLNKTITFKLKPFLRWWRRELAFLIPIQVQRFFHTPSVAIILRPTEEGQFEFSYEIDGTQKYLTTIARDSSKAAAVNNLVLSDKRFKNASFVLRLTANKGLAKSVNLPLAAQANVSQVIGYELDRYTPFKAEQVYFATRVEKIDKEASQITLQLFLTPRKCLEQLYSDCKKLGITLQFVDMDNHPIDLQDLHSAYNLLPPHLQPNLKNMSRFVVLGLLTSLSFLSLSSLVLPIWLEHQAIENLQTKISKVEKEVRSIKALQSEMDGIREEVQTLISEKTATPSVVSVLNELSRLMKDDGWLAYLQYGEGQLQLQGESLAASNLLADLEASDYFAKVNFVSPVTQDKASGSERFQITAEVVKPADDSSTSSDTTESVSTTVAPTTNNVENENTDDTPVEDTTVENVTSNETEIENGTTEE